jgi:hypothetical protein
MTQKKRFLLRLDPALYAAIERWASDELRSVNAQMEYLLSQIARKAGRHRVETGDEGTEPPSPEEEP